ncbi:MAG: response regulator transcription factor [Saprospiraceae bacterium]|nr:response regulator transcription factor [Saprospiraceae bacterium]
MVNAIIIDDEPAARASLELELELHCPTVRVIAQAGSVLDAIQTLEQHPNTDLLFLDIQLTDGSGFDVLQNINYQALKIIFTTAYSEYALRAIKYTPLDYLLKPIDAEELKTAVEKAMRNNLGDTEKQLQALMKQLYAGSNPPRIALTTADGIHLYFIKNIVRCASDGNYTTVHFDDKSKLLVAKTLKDLESMLELYRFERIHKSHLINLDHLRRYHNRFAGEVEMSDGAVLPVAQRKKSRLLELLNQINS